MENLRVNPPVKDSLTMLREMIALSEAEEDLDNNIRDIQIPEQQKQEFKQQLIREVWLTRKIIDLLEAVERPDGTKVLSGIRQMSGGERKKIILDLLNYLLVNAGMSAMPGALGEMIYKDLCFPCYYDIKFKDKK